MEKQQIIELAKEYLKDKYYPIARSKGEALKLITDFTDSIASELSQQILSVDWDGFKNNLNTYFKKHKSIEIDFLKELFDGYSELQQMTEISDEEIEKYFKQWTNPRIKTADKKYEKWLNKYLDELIDSAIEGAKAMRDGKI